MNGDFPLWRVELLHHSREEGGVRRAPAPVRWGLNTHCAHSTACPKPQIFKRSRKP